MKMRREKLQRNPAHLDGKCIPLPSNSAGLLMTNNDKIHREPRLLQRHRCCRWRQWPSRHPWNWATCLPRSSGSLPGNPADDRGQHPSSLSEADLVLGVQHLADVRWCLQVSPQTLRVCDPHQLIHLEAHVQTRHGNFEMTFGGMSRMANPAQSEQGTNGIRGTSNEGRHSTGTLNLRFGSSQSWQAANDIQLHTASRVWHGDMQCLAELSPGTGVNREPEPRLQSAGHLEFRYPAPKNWGSKRLRNGSRLKKGQKPSKEGQRGWGMVKEGQKRSQRVREGQRGTNRRSKRVRNGQNKRSEVEKGSKTVKEGQKVVKKRSKNGQKPSKRSKSGQREGGKEGRLRKRVKEAQRGVERCKAEEV